VKKETSKEPNRREKKITGHFICSNQEGEGQQRVSRKKKAAKKETRFLQRGNKHCQSKIKKLNRGGRQDVNRCKEGGKGATSSQIIATPGAGHFLGKKAARGKS